MPGLPQLPVVLPGQVGEHRLLRALGPLAAHGGADGDVLDRAGGPVVPADGEPHTDHRVRADEHRLLLEPGEGAQARGVPRLRDDRQLL